MDVIAIEFDVHARKFTDVEIILQSGYVVMGRYGGRIFFIWQDILVPAIAHKPFLPTLQIRDSILILL
jgi:hypothetical protein